MKRNFNLSGLTAKKAKMDERTAHSSGSSGRNSNPYLSVPAQPEKSLQKYLTNVRAAARRFLPREQQNAPVTKPFCEVEARLGILKTPHAMPDRRVTSTGAKRDANSGAVVRAFDCTEASRKAKKQNCGMASGVSRTHYTKWAAAGISEHSPLSAALGVTATSGDLKKDLVETQYVETVYSGYPDERRVVYPGLHSSSGQPMTGKMEAKERLSVMDLAIPAAPYDMRISLASEKTLNPAIPHQPPPGWTSQRIKRRRSYTRRDKSIAWQIDVTEVTSTSSSQAASSAPHVDYEIEMELRESVMLQLLNESNPEKLNKMTQALSQQLWWILSNLNPLHEALDVEETLRDHPNHQAVQLALAQCGALRQCANDNKNGNSSGAAPVHFNSPLATPDRAPPVSMTNVKFVGCMPVNFQRHNIEEIQRSPSNSYFMSEKTDGVRYFLIFTGTTAVLVDRAMRGKQPIPISGNEEPFAPLLKLIKPGTVFDGEVVMNRRAGRKPRPIFIVFDVLTISTTEAVLHLPFERRLEHLRRATFRTPTANRDMFDPANVANENFPLPLVRKNFVKRTQVDELLSFVSEDKGMRCYRNGELHNHLTDGIIFQPNLPYICGTDVNLLKWKYLDTVTIDVELLPLLPTDDDSVLRVACLGEENTRVDMTRHIRLPASERMRLEADKFESGGRIAEVGFDPETGEWYYLTMRDDKVAPNHISTVLGTLLELGECLTMDELRYRMSVPAGSRDTYRKDMRGMLKQLLGHQRRQLQSQKR